ncbi:MAG TPA: NAD(P)-dependent oxidoreductase [Candidatus Binataceae bacterium]|nr:NAD(P)-dependent oxidoreductase [Candidatus Binataceae bacterium]
MKRVLITGASGFIGRQCIPVLEGLGYEVHAVSSRGFAHGDDTAVRWHRADLLDYGQVETLISAVGPTHLMHLAWYVVPGKYLQSPENFRWTDATLKLSMSFAKHGGKRAVYAGTCFEYDPRFGYCTEDLTPARSESIYGSAKNAARETVCTWARTASLSVAWGRIFHLFGPDESPERLVPAIIAALCRKRRMPLTHGRQLRDFLHVHDVARALAGILEDQVEGVVNIGSGAPITIRDLALKIADQLDARDMLDFGALNARPGEPDVLIPNVTRLHRELRWRPRFDLAEGLKDTIAWWLQSMRQTESRAGGSSA